MNEKKDRKQVKRRCALKKKGKVELNKEEEKKKKNREK